MKTIKDRKLKTGDPLGFTLIELLVVISIIGVLAGLSIPVLASVKATQKKNVARGELEFLETALENYKAKYGVYPPDNQKASSANYIPATLPQLYYELSGTTNNGSAFVTLDGSSSISINPANLVNTAYGVSGFVNCTKGSGEDAANAKDFISGIKPNQVYSYWTNGTAGVGAPTTILVTSVGGPDDNYHPLDPTGGTGPNPFRYVYPGTNNPGSYDLWVQLSIGGKHYLICNWSREIQINSPLP